MFPLLSGLISGGSSLLGSIFSSNTSAQNTQLQMQNQQQLQTQSENFNADQAQISRDYSTQMSNTAYQRASADMKSAGLNPMMMAGGSMNASTPSPATASISTPSAPMPQTKSALADLGQNVARGIDAAVSAKTMDKMTDEIANLKATNAQIQANTLATKATIPLTNAKTTQTQAETSNTNQSTQTELQRTNQLKRSVPQQEWDAIKYLDLSNIPDSARKTGNIASWGAGKAADVISPIISSALGVKKFTSFNDRYGNY